MRKFVIHSVKGITSIVEVECTKVSQMECLLPGLKEGEWMGKIIRPTELLEKSKDGSLEHPIWCWWAFHDSIEECLVSLRKDAYTSILRTKTKRRITEPEIIVEASEEEVSTIIDEVKVVRL